MFYVNPADKKSNKIYESRTRRKPIKNEQEQTENAKSVFQATLQESIVEQTNKDIELLLADIDRTGKRLQENTTINNLLLYKNSVKKFLQTASKTIFRVTVLHGRKIDLKILRIINDKLKFITDNFFEFQQNKMELLSEIKEIKGMIVNILY